MIAFRPEPHTLLIVVALVETGRPPAGRLARGSLTGASLDDLAHEDLVDGRLGWQAAPFIAARMATPPSSTAATPDIAPPNLPIGVRAALTR